MRYLSVCSGIEAATVAWHHLGWTPAAFSEIEPFPSAVLAHHYPDVPNVGDMTRFKEWDIGSIDLLVGGTPCQSFSVAGLRKGLHDPRGGLMLTFLEIAQRYRPRWLIWENVPGVLSSNGGRDFGAFLGALGELGYGWAYRVLDAQWFGVAQRRRRVFVVGCLGDQASAAAVLFESESVSRNPPPRREARQGFARGVEGSTTGGSLHDTVGALCADSHPGAYSGQDAYTGRLVPQPVTGSHWDSPLNPHPTLNQSAKGSGGIAASDQELFSQRGSGLVPQAIAIHPHVVGRSPNASPQGKEYIDDGSAYCMDARGVPQSVVQPVAIRDVAQALTSNYGKQPDNSDTALGPNVVMQPIGFNARQDPDAWSGRTGPLDTDGSTQAVVFQSKQSATAQAPSFDGVSPTLDVAKAGGMAVAIRSDVTPKWQNDLAFTLTQPSPTGGGQPQAVAQPVAFSAKDYGADAANIAPTLRAMGHSDSHANGGGQVAVAQPVDVKQVQWASGGGQIENDTAQALRAGAEYNYQFARVAMQVRRLTPTECERLQGFPDGYTNIPWRKKDEAPDGPRYKALGNSMAVPCMRWIGERIDAALRREDV